jgi:hypothetical protein
VKDDIKSNGHRGVKKNNSTITIITAIGIVILSMCGGENNSTKVATKEMIATDSING